MDKTEVLLKMHVYSTYYVQLPNEELLSHLTSKQRQQELQQRKIVKFDFEMIYNFVNDKWVQGI